MNMRGKLERQIWLIGQGALARPTRRDSRDGCERLSGLWQSRTVERLFVLHTADRASAARYASCRTGGNRR